jgi:hypothetical protein
MRTCPNCGKDTDAGVTEPCTVCGFSPLGESSAELDDSPEWRSAFDQPDEAFTPADDSFASADESFKAADESFPDPDDPLSGQAEEDEQPTGTVDDGASDADGVEEQPVKKKRHHLITLIVIAVLAVIGILDGGDDPTGPQAGDVESALIADGVKLGVVVTVDCDDSIEDTKVGKRFTCEATNQAGDVRTVHLVNKRHSFVWQRDSLIELKRLDRSGA